MMRYLSLLLAGLLWAASSYAGPPTWAPTKPAPVKAACPCPCDRCPCGPGCQCYGGSCPASILPWRNDIERQLRAGGQVDPGVVSSLARIEAKLDAMLHDRGPSPSAPAPAPFAAPAPAPQIIILQPPLQQLPPSGVPRQELPPSGEPRQVLPPSGPPLQVLPPSGVPRQDLPPSGVPRMEIVPGGEPRQTLPTPAVREERSRPGSSTPPTGLQRYSKALYR